MTKTNISVVDKIAEKLQKSPVGEFLDESDLVSITTQAVERAFFKDRSIQETIYPHRSIQKPPLIVEYAQQHVSEHINSIVAKIVNEKLEEEWKTNLEELFREQLDKITVETVAQTIIHTLIASAIDTLKVEIQQTIINEFNNRMHR